MKLQVNYESLMQASKTFALDHNTKYFVYSAQENYIRNDLKILKYFVTILHIFAS